jgi:7-cyano-7-deazaguanine synthase
MSFRKAIVVVDGSVESAVLLAQVLKDNNYSYVMTMYPNFGLEADSTRWGLAYSLAKFYGVSMMNLELEGTIRTVGLEYFEPRIDETIEVGVVANPHVPFRNGVIISTAVAYAYAHGIRVVLVPSRKGANPFDNSTEFDVPFANAVIAGTDGETNVLMPFERDELEYVVERGMKMDVPFELTNSCESAEKFVGSHCGKCEGCLERKLVFNALNKQDLVSYAG